MNEIQHFRKIHALISEEFYRELISKNKFDSNWDFFVASAIKEKMERDSA